MERSSSETMEIIRLDAMRGDTLVHEMLGEAGLPPGANVGLPRLACIFGNILEVLNDHEAQVPSTSRSITKTEG